ncbi:fumarate hydratase [candidate division WOR-1 bacterium RIFCSPHIGHO2_01_FULL_53_15]|uniref:Fumarate hydratase n=1 Tax=candidate division WOR-1 bacterium RIFCSPHIGHO2_01_FULL_53_15 TaxID=1802564 RepID=A0A1F4Q179_UNCSA|nr:MAG: fumarate hydratase [candidate division WOR-1 bacterium RIFCSPHIGHO2_01_FULL_53_15]OGC13890.1 MAG: fumarate hydratase [candidate division WOR-1 bacterium RIFCSPHIGHO2_02_FULL_53_26]
MREISTKKITETVKNLCLEAGVDLPADILDALNDALKTEESPLGREIIRQIIKNAEIAKKEKMPLCQDTGLAVVFIELGQAVRLLDGQLEEAVNEGVSQGYHKGFLRKSVAADPLIRENTGDNTPAVIHTEIVPGDKIRLQLMAKGGGAENRSASRMFKPTSTKDEIEQFILETVEKAGPNACPPLIVGVGLGGNFESSALMAKKALLRPIGRRNSGFDTCKWEKSLLDKINKLGVGPMGVGGTTTALAINIERRPCHISSLPVAVNIECHAHRFKETVI